MDVFCALVPNYYTLLLSRALIGLCMGVNAATAGVLFSENVSSRHVFHFGTFIMCFFYNIGSGWVAVLGYLFLDSMGWRWFLLLTSVPFFIVPIGLLHCCVKDERRSEESSYTSLLQGAKDGKNSTQPGTAEENTAEETAVPNYKTRIFKSSLFDYCNQLGPYYSFTRS